MSPVTPVSQTTNRRDLFLATARAEIGKPYVYGAEGPDTFDCSGLVYFCLRAAGVDVPRLSAQGYQDMYRPSPVSIMPAAGDLVFYYYSNTRGIPPGRASHIEIATGPLRAIGADHPGEPIREEPIDTNAFIGAGKVPELGGASTMPPADLEKCLQGLRAFEQRTGLGGPDSIVQYVRRHPECQAAFEGFANAGLPNPLSALEAIAKAIIFLADPKNWLRVGEAMAGAGLIGLGTWFLVSGAKR